MPNANTVAVLLHLARAVKVAFIIRAYNDSALQSLPDATRADRRYYLDLFADRFGALVIRDNCRHYLGRCDCLKPSHFLQWLNSYPDWKSDWTKHNAAKHVQAVLNWAVDIEKIIQRNPIARIGHRSGESRRPIADDEFQSLLRATAYPSRHHPSPGARIRQILIFMRRCGARPSEAAALSWPQIDFPKGIVKQKVHKTARMQKELKPRIIVLDAVTIKLLQWIKRHDYDAENGIVFRNQKLTAWNKDSLGHRLRRMRKRAGVSNEATLYGVRHAFATRAIKKGCDIKTLAQLMGHTTTRMTEKYIHLAEEYEYLAAALCKINS